jgi:hypothetical protein
MNYSGLHHWAEGGSGDRNEVFSGGRNWLLKVAVNRFPSGLFDDRRLHCASPLPDDHRFENAIGWQP